MSTISRIIKNIVWSRRLFEFWQKLGVNVTKKHFYSPIPDTRELKNKVDLWTKKSELPGIDINLEGQMNFLEKIFPLYKNEFNFPINKTKIPHEYYLNNAAFGLEDATVLHCMIRHFQPRTIIEIGSGYSTCVSARACLMNRRERHRCKLTSIDPYPRRTHREGFDGLDAHIAKKIEDVEADFFEKLEENDILFIDSSHIVRTGGDVIFLFLEILARLKKGVVVHIHDIFLPFEYPRKWVIDNQTFLSEQYLLQAFLCFNKSFEVLFGNHFIKTTYPEKARSLFVPPKAYSERLFYTSFWIRKII